MGRQYCCDKTLITYNIPRLKLFLFLCFNEATRTYIQIKNCSTKSRFLTAFWAHSFLHNYTESHVDMSNELPFCRFNHQNNEFPGETELPPGLWGCNQQADQSGAVCLLCLPVYGESDLDGCTSSSDRWVCLNCGDMVFIWVYAIKQRLQFHLSCVECWAEGSSWETVSILSPGLTLCAFSFSDDHLGSCE